MILSIYAIVGFVALALILLSKSHKNMNALSAIHALVYFMLAIYALSYTAMPVYYLEDKYFFIDHLGAYEVLITSILFVFAAICSKGYIEGSIKLGELNPENLKLYYAAFNLLLISITYSFFSNNFALFWIFAELTTVFSAVLVVTLNAKKNIGAALKYVFIASTSMLFSFIGLIFLFTLTEHALGTGTLNWDLLMLNAAQLSPTILLASFIFIFIGFAAKSGIVPFHAWLPTAHSKAPAPISVILSGCVTNVGIYGILRMYSIMAQTTALHKVSLILFAFGLFSMAVAVFSMLSQPNLKKLIGYSTIENMSLMLMGIGLGTGAAIYWVLFYILIHSLIKALLFLSAGVIHHQYDSVRIERIKDALKLQPLASWGLILGSAAIAGMPPFAIFIPKLFILIETAKISGSMLFVLLMLLLVAGASLAIFLAGMFSQNGLEDGKIEKYAAPGAMKFSIVALLVIIFVLGIFFPQSLTDLLNTIVTELRLG